MRALVLALALSAGFLAALAPAHAQTVAAPATGTASFYARGRLTASGAPFRPLGLSAAHRTLPFGTRVRVTDLATGRTVVVTINDRGPALWTGRLIDLSRGAARALGFEHRGLARVALAVL